MGEKGSEMSGSQPNIEGEKTEELSEMSLEELIILREKMDKEIAVRQKNSIKDRDNERHPRRYGGSWGPYMTDKNGNPTSSYGNPGT